MIDLLQIGLGLGLSTCIGGLAYWRRSLTASGWVGAVLVGTATFGFGGWAWGLTLIVFFISSSLLSHYKERIKEQRAAEKFAKGGRRDLMQALANGGLAALCALAYATLGQPTWLLFAFVGLMATVTADTWATELGVLSPHQPRLISTGKPVEPGTSGGVTLFGTGASAAGALVIGLCFVLFSLLELSLGGYGGSGAWLLILIALLSGVAGALFDSLMGATVQAIFRYPDGRETERRVGRDGTPNAFVRGIPWLGNDLVNLISSVVGALVAVGLGLILL